MPSGFPCLGSVWEGSGTENLRATAITEIERRGRAKASSVPQQCSYYGSARGFLDAEPEGRTSLALLDVKMAGP